MSNYRWPTLRLSGRGALKHLCAAAAVLVSSLTNAQTINVSGSGQASVEISLAVPPGVNGLAPALSLVYSDGIGNGPLGVGWAIGGLSEISRCTNVPLLDGNNRGPTLQSTDALCLDGRRLVGLTARGNFNVGDQMLPTTTAQSVTFPHSFQVVQGTGSYDTEYLQYAGMSSAWWYGAPDSGAKYFDVSRPSDRRVMRYGEPEASPYMQQYGGTLMAVGSRTIAYKWLLTRVTDGAGNLMRYRYGWAPADPAWGTVAAAGVGVGGHEYTVREILYGRAQGGQPFDRKVVFEYETRPSDNLPGADRAETYWYKNRWVSTRRLTAISAYVNSPDSDTAALSSAGPAAGAIKVRSYKFGYERSPQTGRSRLVTVTECAGPNASICMPPTRITYRDNGPSVSYAANGGFSASGMATLRMSDSTGANGGAYGALTGDFNGDGRTDIVRWSNTNSENQLWLSAGDGNFTLTAAPALQADALHSANGCYKSYAADVNGDGLTDIIRSAGCGLQSLVLLSTGNGGFTRTVLPSGIDLAQKKASVTVAYESVVVCRPSGSCYWVSQQMQRRWEGKRFYFIDLNGDGVLDIVTTIAPAYLWYVGPPWERDEDLPASYGNGPLPDDAVWCASSTCTRAYLGNVDANGNLGYNELSAPWFNAANASLYSHPDFTNGDPYWRPPGIANLTGTSFGDILGAYSGRWISLGTGAFAYSPVQNDSAACTTALDFNGDGRADCLKPAATGPAQALSLSLGAEPSAAIAGFNVKGASDNLVAFDTSNRQTVGHVAFDFDGDGREDLLRWGPTPADNGIYLSNGDGTFRARASAGLDLITRPLRAADGSSTFVTGDFLGAGTLQILHLKDNPNSTNGAASSNQLYVRGGSNLRPDLMATLTTPAGLTSTVVARVPLTNAAGRYVSERVANASATANVQDRQPASDVVTTLRRDSGVGAGSLTTEYFYKGMKFDRKAGRFLGFHEVRSQSPAPNETDTHISTSQFLIDFPYTGSVARAKTYLAPNSVSALTSLSGATLLSDTSNVYCNAGNALQEGSATETAPCGMVMVSGTAFMPYLAKSTANAWDLTGVALPTKIGTTSYVDLAANKISHYPMRVTATTTGTGPAGSQTFVSTTANEYHPYTLYSAGRLKKSTQTSTVPNALSGVSTTAGPAPKASATTGP